MDTRFSTEIEFCASEPRGVQPANRDSEADHVHHPSESLLRPCSASAGGQETGPRAGRETVGGARAAGKPLPVECRRDAAATPETFYGGYLTVSGIYRRLDEMAATYPTITELIDYGDSYSKTVGGTVTPDGQELAGYDCGP